MSIHSPRYGSVMDEMLRLELVAQMASSEAARLRRQLFERPRQYPGVLGVSLLGAKDETRAALDAAIEAEKQAGTDPKEDNLRRNLEFNKDMRAVVENRNSYLTTRPFGEHDAVADPG